MTRTEKEQIQYLLIQYLEQDSSAEENELLFQLLIEQTDNDEWETILKELMASEPEQPSYESEKWDSIIEKIIHTASKEKKTVVEKPAIKQKSEASGKILRLPNRKWLPAISAAAVLITVISLWVVLKAEDKSLIATEYAQQKRIKLPDETEIILNSKSDIRYLKRWKNGQPREVWLKGEAHFKVKHINTDSGSVRPEERFIVHTDLANIEVLGTVFNVRERRRKTEIVLEQGSIKVSFIQTRQPDIIMQPGQIVSMTKESKKVATNSINPQDYTAWTRKKLVLTNASFQQIVEYLEDNFGKHIVLSDPELANRGVEGIFKIDNMDDALLVLSKALNVDITQKGDTLIFIPR